MSCTPIRGTLPVDFLAYSVWSHQGKGGPHSQKMKKSMKEKNQEIRAYASNFVFLPLTRQFIPTYITVSSIAKWGKFWKSTLLVETLSGLCEMFRISIPQRRCFFFFFVIFSKTIFKTDHGLLGSGPHTPRRQQIELLAPPSTRSSLVNGGLLKCAIVRCTESVHAWQWACRTNHVACHVFLNSTIVTNV